MNKVKKVWVLAEKQDALAQLCAGGVQLGEEVAAIVPGTKDEAEKAALLGAGRVYWLGEPRQNMMFEDYFETILQLIKQERPNLLMVAPTKRGKLVAGRLAAALGTSVLADANEIMTDGKIGITHMVYGGAAFRVEEALTETAVITVGWGVFDALPKDEDNKGTVIETVFIEPAQKIKRLEKKQKQTVSVNLSAAKRVVALGRGVEKQEDIQLIAELAAGIGAEIGCSRPIAEGVNWLPNERYIGVSGAMLKPDVYIAAGISGQVQHMVGVNQARVIIAINKDKGAPIFKQADYGIVGDLYKVIPQLIEKLK